MSNQTLMKPVSPLYRFGMCRIEKTEIDSWYASFRRHLWILEHQSGRLPAWSEVAFLYDIKNEALYVGIPLLGSPYQLSSAAVFDIHYKPKTQIELGELKIEAVSHIPCDFALCLKKSDELFSEGDGSWSFVGLAAKDVALVNS